MPLEIDMRTAKRSWELRLKRKILCFIGKHDWGDNCYWDSNEVWLTCYQCGKDMDRKKSDAIIYRNDDL